ncbi:MAG: hypothetical protein KatS3mg031_2593 [Chitinophagales bacterium]|nr:MAG: hypothetical protein KatS3mg031_2593 [Chitinophagales bacterium]
MFRYRFSVFVLLLYAAGLFYACQPPEEKSLEQIKEAEAALFGDGSSFTFDESAAIRLIQAYSAFVQEHPKSKKAPEMLLKAADLYRSMQQPQNALKLYQEIESSYPEFEKIPQIIFLEGFTYENELNDLNAARERYETFLQKYPNHELADDVEFSLKNLGKSPEDIIRSFEQADSTVQQLYPDTTLQ